MELALKAAEDAMREARPIRKTAKPIASNADERLDRIRAQAESIWGNETDATEWLNSPHPELRGATPVSLLKTKGGSRTVEALLGALEFGLPV
jgi:putative toxin-antitoxin system antitoxin component (TIGR02293 family)